MNLVPVGIGPTGIEVVDKLLEYETLTDRSLVDTPVVVDSRMENLVANVRVPPNNRVVVGQSHKGHDDDLAPEDGAEITNAGLESIQGTIDNAAVDVVDAFLVIARIGNGLASGGAPVLSKHLSDVYSKPVLGLAILPNDADPASELDIAARSFGAFSEAADHLLVFDPATTTNPTDRAGRGAPVIAEEIANRLGFLFSSSLSGGEDDPITPHDTSKLLASLSGDGYSSFGYASESIKLPLTLKLLAVLSSVSGSVIDADRVTLQLDRLVQRATREARSVSEPHESPEGGIVVIAGPPSVPQAAVDRCRAWLGEEFGDVDIPVITRAVSSGNSMAVTVVLSGLKGHDRLDEVTDSMRSDEALEAILTDS